MKNHKIGLGITGSFCTFGEMLPYAEQLAKDNQITNILSYSVASYDTRFYKAADFRRDLVKATNGAVVDSIVAAEPIGPKKLLDLMIIAPCTGNTLAKLSLGITDTPVLMAAKAHLRNNRPVVVAVSTNDALAANAKNIGALLNTRNIYFVPMRQDDSIKKERSMVADLSKLMLTCKFALDGVQLQPVMM